MTDRELLEQILQKVTQNSENIAKLGMSIELEIKPDIQKLAEGHELILERIDEKIADRTEDLQDEIDVHSAAIKRLNRELRELKKAQ